MSNAIRELGATASAGRGSLPWRFTCLASLFGVLGFLGWCVVDYIAVRVLTYPERVHDLDWTLLLFPPVVFILGACLLPYKSTWLACLLGGAMAVTSAALALLLVAFIGMPFHLSIGGQF